MNPLTQYIAKDIMRASPRTVEPEMTLVDLERAFLDERVSGFPVVKNGRLIGIVSRSDIVRQLGVEQSLAEMTSDYFREFAGYQEDPAESLETIAVQVGRRIEELRVKDCMIPDLFEVSPDTPLPKIAQTLIEHHVHRLLVTQGDELLGIISTLDLTRLIADGKI